VPAAAVIPTPQVNAKVAAVKKFVFGFLASGVESLHLDVRLFAGPSGRRLLATAWLP